LTKDIQQIKHIHILLRTSILLQDPQRTNFSINTDLHNSFCLFSPSFRWRDPVWADH